ncbi:LLM class oxidoreductase [Chroococcidiopsis sp. CCMEE 29]|uniref:LLM class oxidoreductase n=1 Tax=Chroococcidiopsis sp. CCMEE 29 TaxID=155894 RepID=UPI0020213DF1|nr:LLM class oxidoreductase [Chroococcidiopsis sp. CCMEE 29]
MTCNLEIKPLITFTHHPGFRRMFAPGKLTVGLFLPLWQYAGDLEAMRGQVSLVKQAERARFAAVWVRDVPLHDPNFGDVGQVFDLFTYLGYLAAQTTTISLATGSAIFTLRHPIDLAKAAASIDQLSGGRLVLGVASGDRPIEFPAYGIHYESRAERFREAIALFRRYLRESFPIVDSPISQLSGADLLPKPATGDIPLLITGSSRQSMEWVAANGDGWLSYPGNTSSPSGAAQLGMRIEEWRKFIPNQMFKPHATNEWIDLSDDPDEPPTPLRGGFILRVGRRGLIDLLRRWQSVGVNHAALGIQHGHRPAAEVIAELAEEVLPHFPALISPIPANAQW